MPGIPVDPSITSGSWEERLDSKGCGFTAAGMGTSEQCLEIRPVWKGTSTAVTQPVLGTELGWEQGRIPALIPQAELHTRTPLRLWQQDHLAELGPLG